MCNGMLGVGDRIGVSAFAFGQISFFATVLQTFMSDAARRVMSGFFVWGSVVVAHAVNCAFREREAREG